MGESSEQEALKRAAQTDKVVRGVDGSVVPRAQAAPVGGHHRRCNCRPGGTVHAPRYGKPQ